MDTSINFPLHRCKQWPRQQMQTVTSQHLQTVAKSTDASSDQINRCKQWPSQQMQTVIKSTDANSGQVNRCKQWPSQQMQTVTKSTDVNSDQINRCKQWPNQQMQTATKSTDANKDQINRCKQWPSQQMQTVTKSTDANSDQVNRCKQWPSQQAPCTNRISIHTVNIQLSLWWIRLTYDQGFNAIFWDRINLSLHASVDIQYCTKHFQKQKSWKNMMFLWQSVSVWLYGKALTRIQILHIETNDQIKINNLLLLLTDVTWIVYNFFFHRSGILSPQNSLLRSLNGLDRHGFFLTGVFLWKNTQRW